MKRSLSVVIQLLNAQATVEPIVAQLVDLLPELTPDFDLLLVDDGSIDATVEVAVELATSYPQVRLVVHPQRLGFAGTLRTGLDYSRGELLLARPDDSAVALGEIHKLWASAAEYDLAVVRSRSSAGLGRIPQSPNSKASSPPALALMRRIVLEEWRTEAGHRDPLAYLIGKGYRHREYVGRDYPAITRVAGAAARMSARTAQGHSAAMLEAASIGGEGQPKRPNYLARLKAFALGE